MRTFVIVWGSLNMHEYFGKLTGFMKGKQTYLMTEQFHFWDDTQEKQMHMSTKHMCKTVHSNFMFTNK